MKKSKIIISVLIIILSLLLSLLPIVFNAIITHENVIGFGTLYNIMVNNYIVIIVSLIRSLIRFGLLILFLILNLVLKEKNKMIFNAIFGCIMILLISFNSIATLISYYDVISFPRLFIFELNEFTSILITASLVIYIFNSISNGKVLFFINTILNISLILVKILFMIVILLGYSSESLIIYGIYDLLYILLLIIIDALFIIYFWINE